VCNETENMCLVRTALPVLEPCMSYDHAEFCDSIKSGAVAHGEAVKEVRIAYNGERSGIDNCTKAEITDGGR
jgi:hypothetical protein